MGEFSAEGGGGREPSESERKMAKKQETIESGKPQKTRAASRGDGDGQRTHSPETATELFHTVFGESPMAIEIYDAEGGLLDANKACLEMFGVSDVESVRGFKLFDDPNLSREAKAELRRGERVAFESEFDFEKVKAAKLYPTSRSGIVYLSVVLTPLGLKSQGGVKGYLVQIQEITRLHEAEEAHRGLAEEMSREKQRSASLDTTLESERDLLEVIMENTGAHLVYLDTDFNFVKVNSTYAHTCGYEPEQMVGLNHFALYPDEENEAIFARVRDTGKPVEFRAKPFVFPDQPERGVTYWDWTLTPVKAPSGKVKGLVFSLADVTDRVQAEQAVRKSEERFRLLAENATDGIYIFRLDPPGYEYVSPAMTTLFGYEREEWLSDPDLDHKIVHPDDQGLIDRMRTPEGMLTGPVILRCHHRDGRPIWIEHHNAPILDENGKLVAIQGIVRDVSERVQSMEDLERLRSDFLGMVTHELKTPLAAIKGSAATALGASRPLDIEEARELFQIIDEQSDRLRDLADNLLDMSRIEAGALSVKPEPVELGGMIDEARSILARSGRPHRIEVEMPEEIPAVNADRRRVVQVMTNLLTNAAKFSSPSEPIEVRVRHDKLLATIEVQDRGEGIAKDKLPLLFQKFSQVNESSRVRASGTGLGLAICKGIVEAHGGRIWAESEGQGRGATFTFTLPLAAEPESEARPTTPTTTAGVRRSERPRILAVDDELAVLRYLQHSLEEAGYQCMVTSDPSQVTKFVELEQPDLVLLDLRLPGISGFDLLARIREFSSAPVIFLTASDSSEDTVRALKLGADDYVTKPFAPSELLARIEAALRRRSLPGMGDSRPPFKMKELEINFAERRVLLEGKEISLSATEYKLLFELATHSGLVLTFDQILQRVWGAEYAGETELVRSFIRNLRRKLNDDAKQPRYILTERQIGYRMVKE
jgi:PAS domain S-box-containing protein